MVVDLLAGQPDPVRERRGRRRLERARRAACAGSLVQCDDRGGGVLRSPRRRADACTIEEIDKTILVTEAENSPGRGGGRRAATGRRRRPAPSRRRARCARARRRRRTIVVAASSTTHSPRACRRQVHRSSGLMNSHSSQRMTAEMPFPESATASTRWSRDGGSSGTTPTFRRVQAVAGPGSNQPPAAKRIRPRGRSRSRGRRRGPLAPAGGAARARRPPRAPPRRAAATRGPSSRPAAGGSSASSSSTVAPAAPPGLNLDFSHRYGPEDLERQRASSCPRAARCAPARGRAGPPAARRAGARGVHGPAVRAVERQRPSPRGSKKASSLTAASGARARQQELGVDQ